MPQAVIVLASETSLKVHDLPQKLIVSSSFHKILHQERAVMSRAFAYHCIICSSNAGCKDSSFTTHSFEDFEVVDVSMPSVAQRDLCAIHTEAEQRLFSFIA